MRGEASTLKDILLEPVEDLVLPANLLSDEESLSLDDIPEEEPKVLYKVDGNCGLCESRIRLVVGATQQGIRGLQSVLLTEVDLICTTCAKANRNGRK